MTKPEGPAQEPHGKRLMMLPPNPNYPGYVGAHTEDDWCAKAGCIPICVPATPAPSQPAGAREFAGKPGSSVVWHQPGPEDVFKFADEFAAQQTAAKDAEIAGLNANLSCLRDQTQQDGEQMVRLRRERNEMQDLLAEWRPRAEAAERERDSLRAELAALKAGKE